MTALQNYVEKYVHNEETLGLSQSEELRDWFKQTKPSDVTNLKEAKDYIALLRKFREAVEGMAQLNGENYKELLKSLLSVGEDGLYSDNLRFIFELIQNVDDCEYKDANDCELEIHFDFNKNRITLTYNETGFTPFNVFAITGIGEAAKNISADKNQIGEKGIGFKSVFGVSTKVLIRSGWFSFELNEDHFTIPEQHYLSDEYFPGTQMTLFLKGSVNKGYTKSREIYTEIAKQYCKKDALFTRNPLVFLNKLTKLKMYYDSCENMEFNVDRSDITLGHEIVKEENINLSFKVNGCTKTLGHDVKEAQRITCNRYTMPVVYNKNACQSRYGNNTKVGDNGGKKLNLQVVLPTPGYAKEVGKGALYSFLPTQLQLTVPMAIHVPFKLDASREFVDPQDTNLWFRESCGFLKYLMEYVYYDYSRSVKENIVYYIPRNGSSLFERNNGKENCLRTQREFSNDYILNFPIFYTASKTYAPSSKIISFDYSENITEPEHFYSLMGFHDDLFVAPEGFDAGKIGIRIEKDLLERLFVRVLQEPAITKQALDYLDTHNFQYKSDVISGRTSLKFAPTQIEEILQHNELSNVIHNISAKAIRTNMLPTFSIDHEIMIPITNVLPEGFLISDAPAPIENYLKYLNEKCVLLNIDNTDFMACHNAIVLSEKDPVASFAAFCSKVDSNSMFSIRMKLHEATQKLNQVNDDTTISNKEYLRQLRHIRLAIKDSLGKQSYNNFIELILKSGTDSNRFIQELLQNADDCDYPDGETPTFSLSVNGNVITTQYNECGFTRANIRSITAIGESTKKRIFSKSSQSIGEKGIGFKTVFASVSKVSIKSGAFSFSLSAKEPTIPVVDDNYDGSLHGTKMTLSIRENKRIPFDELNGRRLLALCLCLRKLKLIDICGHSIVIEDAENERHITIDKNTYKFKKITHSFVISDERALEERGGSYRKISNNQKIVCYVPEKNDKNIYFVYSGLPTKHKINIPVAIDAPFALTTSREEIDTGCVKWNRLVLNETYQALKKCILALKDTERFDVLRFIRYLPVLSGKERIYRNNIFDDSGFLNSFDFLSILRETSFIPTYDATKFAAPSSEVYIFPKFATLLFNKKLFGVFPPYMIVDCAANDDYTAALNALGIKLAKEFDVMQIIEKYAAKYIYNDEFRTALYKYFEEQQQVQCPPQLRELVLIPVYGSTPGLVHYVSWNNASIYVKKGAEISPNDCYVLNERLMSKSMCEWIGNEHIQALTQELFEVRYNKALEELLQTKGDEEKYSFILKEFQNGNIERNHSRGTLLNNKEWIPLKNRSGNLVEAPIYVCEEDKDYFPVDIIRRVSVNDECIKLARYIDCASLKKIQFDDFGYNEPLTEDDVECINDDYFLNRYEILRGFYLKGLLSDSIVQEYHLAGILNPKSEIKCDFPGQSVGDMIRLKSHIRKQFDAPTKIIKVAVERQVDKGQVNGQEPFELPITEARNEIIRMYSPEGSYGVCCCQMCKKAKLKYLIEVNNIEVTPKYFFKELRVALCLECSKCFESLRYEESIRNSFINKILSTTIADQRNVEIPLDDEYTITFTGKHFAEVQEILRNLKNMK